MLSWAPFLTILLVAGPVLAGLIFTGLPALDVMPSLGRTHPSLAGFIVLFHMPGFVTALRLTLVTGVGAALLSFALAVAFSAEALTRPSWRWLTRLQTPILASPHSAIALGFAFLIAPSGWIVRLLSPWATGWTLPPGDLVTLRDPWGLAMVLGLTLKETPYLVLMIISASAQVPARSLMAAAGALGDPLAVAWIKVVFPSVYRQVRLPMLAVLAFSLSVVDMPLILAPGNPPPLAVLAVRWLTNYDLSMYVPAAAAAMLIMLIVLASGALWWVAEWPVAWLARVWVERGGPNPLLDMILWSAARLAVVLGAAAFAGGTGQALWSVARLWPFPDARPVAFTLATWTGQAQHSLGTIAVTVAVAGAVVGSALVLSLACLEHMQRQRGRLGLGMQALVFAPLLVPQIAFLFGMQVLLVRLHLDGTLIAVAWSHLIFVLPYVLLSLSDPFLALDPRYAASGAALGAGRARVFFALKLPLLIRPIAVAAAVGFAVSFAQYLPTLFAGAGRIATLTTEAVTLSSGGDRRIIGVLAMLQAALPLAAYGLALGAPFLLFRRRGGMRP
ncbi:ABC transporter permease [Lichenihabitans psoromatis]|uniref:ABC transporter permease n=1 Tax=Lichenihabitans psoromatis TaxID=2528642 RepID=UPI001035BF40|nr:ABC transporter permease [Lichenihabitans psoromatis]